MRIMSTRVRAVAAGALAAVALAACSNGGGGDQQPSQQSSGAASGPTVAISQGSLGKMLVDAQGRTLYMFLSDSGSLSTCYGSCASTWPALLASGSPSAGTGLAAAMLGTSKRTDGSTQVTFDGHPLYTYSGDQAAGDTNGEGIADVWFVVSPEGTPIKGGGAGGGGKY
jgi:predicted lipoprotein with Yx(FWY)xxD motif